MKGLLELISVVSILGGFGCLCWAGMQVIASDAGIAGADAQMQSSPRVALIAAGICFVVFVAAGQIKKRLS